MFEVGQRVVCVDDAGQRCRADEQPVVKGHIYTIREIDPGLDGSNIRGGLRFHEIKNPIVWTWWGDMERWYRPERFRPVHETDISIFTAMLNNVPKHEREPV